MTPVINVFNLSKQFSEIKAVDDLSFTVNEGDIYGFLGENGAGKSTTIRILLTLVKPTSGSVRIFGKDLFNHRREILRQTGALIEKPDLYTYLSAYHNLSIFAKMSGLRVGRKGLMNQLELVGLAERAHSRVSDFSQGMKQRLGIAVALVHDPRLIILDEPTNGLDPQGIADIRNLILHLSRDKGKTIIISSHLLNEIELVANRMLIIHKGKKMAEGFVGELLDPARTIVKIEVADPKGTLEKLDKGIWQNASLSGNKISLVINKNEIPRLTADLVNMQAEVMSIIPQHSLENYFLSLTNQTGHVEAFAN